MRLDRHPLEADSDQGAIPVRKGTRNGKFLANIGLGGNVGNAQQGLTPNLFRFQGGRMTTSFPLVEYLATTLRVGAKSPAIGADELQQHGVKDSDLSHHRLQTMPLPRSKSRKTFSLYCVATRRRDSSLLRGLLGHEDVAGSFDLESLELLHALLSRTALISQTLRNPREGDLEPPGYSPLRVSRYSVPRAEYFKPRQTGSETIPEDDSLAHRPGQERVPMQR